MDHEIAKHKWHDGSFNRAWDRAGADGRDDKAIGGRKAVARAGDARP